jgi:hypothetical protein
MFIIEVSNFKYNLNLGKQSNRNEHELLTCSSTSIHRERQGANFLSCIDVRRIERIVSTTMFEHTAGNTWHVTIYRWERERENRSTNHCRWFFLVVVVFYLEKKKKKHERKDADETHSINSHLSMQIRHNRIRRLSFIVCFKYSQSIFTLDHVFE